MSARRGQFDIYRSVRVAAPASLLAVPPVTVRTALRRAASDFWHHSWRLCIFNSLLSAVAIAILYAAVRASTALVLVLALGPVAAAVMHCAVTVAQTQEVRVRDVAAGLRQLWRRGLALGALVCAFFGFGIFALLFYARGGVLAWPLSILVLYLLVLFALLQLALWPIAVFHRERPFRAVLLDAAVAFGRRPGGWIALGLALLLVNLAGIAAGVLPFLTLTIAYSFVAAAHFALPRPSLEEA